MITTQSQWGALAQICALSRLAPKRLTHVGIGAARHELLVIRDRYGRESRRGLSTAIFGLEAMLFHSAVIDELPRKRARTKADIRAAHRG